MGGAAWGYWMPYRDGDIDQALASLRTATFESGRYHLRHLGFGPDFDALQAELDEDEDERAAYEAEHGAGENEEPWRDRRPGDIDDLLRGNAEDGTHSIIDVDGVSETPTWGKAAPLSDSELVALFGTTTPSRDDVLSQQRDVQAMRPRWFGTYVVAYANDAPSEIFFSGHSGD